MECPQEPSQAARTRDRSRVKVATKRAYEAPGVHAGVIRPARRRAWDRGCEASFVGARGLQDARTGATSMAMEAPWLRRRGFHREAWTPRRPTHEDSQG